MTTRLVYGEDERLLPWAAEKIGIPAFRSDARTIGLERDGELVAVVVFDTFSDTDAYMHIASDGTRRWLSKELLLAAFAYPFKELGLLRLTGMVDERNAQALAFDEHIGFVREGYHPNAAGPGVAMVSLGLQRANCKFIVKD